MAVNEQTIATLLKSGRMSVDELKSELADASSVGVSVQGLEACYSSATGQLSAYCTVIADSGQIDGIGFVMYSADGATMYCAQYTNGFEGTAIAPSIGTQLYSPQDGNQVLCIVYGSATSGPFRLIQTLNVGSC